MNHQHASRPLTRPLILGVTLAAACAATAVSPGAHASPFAEPPDQPAPIATGDPRELDPPRAELAEEEPFYHPRSTVRVGVGPALRLGNPDHADGGLFGSVDFGDDAAGLRLSGHWVQSGASEGLAQYGASLWLDFARRSRLHPLIGAGAAYARLSVTSDTGARESYDVGVGSLWAGLHYLLPLSDIDARATLEATGVLPAIRPASAPRIDPWMLVTAGVQVGF